MCTMEAVPDFIIRESGSPDRSHRAKPDNINEDKDSGRYHQLLKRVSNAAFDHDHYQFIGIEVRLEGPNVVHEQTEREVIIAS